MGNIALTVDTLNHLQPLAIVTNDAVRSRFIQIYDTLWGAGTGEAAYEREFFHFNNTLREKEQLQKATNFSIFTCFIDLAVCGLSLEPGTRALCYLQGRNACIGTDPNDPKKKIYEGRLNLTISGYGELVLRARAGQIKYADNPVLVYDEDEFSFGDMGGQKVVNYMCHLPHKSNHIQAAFLRITRADGSVDYSVMLEEDWARLMQYSAENNRKWNSQTRQFDCKANELYTSRNGGIDSGFLAAKLIKHAFKTYPKVRIGKSTDLETQQAPTVQQEVDDFYGVASTAPAAPQAPADFADPLDTSAGVTVTTQPSTDLPAAPQTMQQVEDDGAF